MSLLSRENATFSSVDLAVLANSAPALGRQLLRTVKEYLHQNLIKLTQSFGGSTIDVADLPLVLADFSMSDGHG
jgi:hypothetical protein